MACTWLHLADLTQQFRSSLPRPPPSSLVCSEIMAVHSDSIDSAHPMRFLRSLTCRSMESPSSLRSVKSESAGHRHRSLWLLRERHARTVLAERRRGEDLHEAECERLVARRSERQGEWVWAKGTGQLSAPTVVLKRGGPSAALQPPPPAPEPRLGRPAVPEEGDSGVNEVPSGRVWRLSVGTRLRSISVVPQPRACALCVVQTSCRSCHGNRKEWDTVTLSLYPVLFYSRNGNHWGVEPCLTRNLHIYLCASWSEHCLSLFYSSVFITQSGSGSS